MSTDGLVGYSPSDKAIMHPFLHFRKCLNECVPRHVQRVVVDNRVVMATLDTSAVDGPADDQPAEPTGAQLNSAAGTFALLASPTRLHLVWLITNGPYDVGTLAKRVGLNIATVSQHLGKLRLSGVITARRAGRHQIYAVEDPHVIALVEQIFEHIAPDGGLAPDPPR